VGRHDQGPGFVGFVERRQVLAIYRVAQRDEPPGRGDVATRHVLVAQAEHDVPTPAVARVVEATVKAWPS
jgi:hypothetical protein